MGSKTSLLPLGLGGVIDRELEGKSRFVDLFSGSGAVSYFVAERHAKAVLSVDTQEYSAALVRSVLERTTAAPLAPFSQWIETSTTGAAALVKKYKIVPSGSETSAEVTAQREIASAIGPEVGFITRDYGGHYFSVEQSLAMDVLHENIQHLKPRHRPIALAALIETASACAAAPGHTAQPFQPGKNLLPHIFAAWRRSPLAYAREYSSARAARFALARGRAEVGDAVERSSTLNSSDLIFCDPPYSEVQYSRFYHVLEGIAVGGWPSVSGAGRAPSTALRVSSEFSKRSRSTNAFRTLFESVAEVGASIILTFPVHEASNGQSAESLADLASPWFAARELKIPYVHSSLGGSNGHSHPRSARDSVSESVMSLTPSF